MGRGVLRNRPFASRSPQPMRERAEPRLIPADTIAPSVPAGQPDWESIVPMRPQVGSPGATPVIAASERLPTALVPSEPGSLRSAVLAGCLLFGLAGVAAAGLLLLAAPSKVSVPAAGADALGPAQAKLAGSPAPSAPAPVPAAATAALPGSAAAPHRAADEPAADSPSGLAPAAVDRARNPSVKAADLPPAAVAAKPVPALHPPAAPAIAPKAAVSAPASGHRRTMSAREPSRFSHPRSEAYAARQPHSPLLREPQSLRSAAHRARPPLLPDSGQPNRMATTTGPQPADQAAAFDQLLAHLTGGSGSAVAAGDRPLAPRPAGPPNPALTPPPPGAPDPFGPPPSTPAPDQ
jgi:hypothetical protein